MEYKPPVAALVTLQHEVKVKGNDNRSHSY